MDLGFNHLFLHTATPGVPHRRSARVDEALHGGGGAALHAPACAWRPIGRALRTAAPSPAPPRRAGARPWRSADQQPRGGARPQGAGADPGGGRASWPPRVASPRPNAHLLPVQEARRNFDADFAELGPGEECRARCEITAWQSQDGEITVRAFRPSAADASRRRLLPRRRLAAGELDSHQAVCRALANAAGAAVFSVDYRRGPESRFPAAVNDAYARDGAGSTTHSGELALSRVSWPWPATAPAATWRRSVAMLARDRGGPELAMQVLAYPVTTTDLSVGFDHDYEGLLASTATSSQWHQDNYLPGPRAPDRPAGVAARPRRPRQSFRPRWSLTAQCDPLHAQGELYAEALERAGVQSSTGSGPDDPRLLPAADRCSRGSRGGRARR